MRSDINAIILIKDSPFQHGLGIGKLITLETSRPKSTDSASVNERICLYLNRSQVILNTNVRSRSGKRNRLYPSWLRMVFSLRISSCRWHVNVVDPLNASQHVHCFPVAIVDVLAFSRSIRALTTLSSISPPQ